MYAELREFADGQNFRAFIDRHIGEALPEGSVRGVHVGADKFWVECWLAEWAWRYVPYPKSYSWPVQRLDIRRLRTFTDVLTFDFDFRPSGWSEHCRSRGYPDDGSPIYIKFILFEDFEWKAQSDLRRSWEGHPLIYEVRPRCRALSLFSGLFSKAQLSIGSDVGLASPSQPGTAGGFMHDPNIGKAYLVSCAHVLPNSNADVFSPSPSGWTTPKKIGEVLFSVMPPQKGPGSSACNKLASPSATSLDLAVVELTGGISPNPEVPNVGPIDHLSLIKNMSPRDPVIFVGMTSGRVEAKLGELNVWDTIDVDGNPHCFGDLFVMKHRQPPYLNRSLAQSGDSGAWVVNESDGVVGWDGMIIAGDGTQAYGCFAEKIKDECDARISSSLALI